VPRDPKAVALQKLAVIHANYRSARQANAKLAEQRRRAIIAAVEVGCTKSSVARVAEVAPARVAAIVNEG
jgi:hypothetical protein